ncbi:flagellar basal-body rod protein FlgF [Aneurinibacillus sp. Ricciae_BoGa-3]|uniref:flagellar basal-body rod protein FlgF n=1 Tax=Aneurinibacillus sp. Ricciae_BoGa-3 TaxID=3022697 RepID=UPI0023422E0A|nr:flagellar basal-body rod protein FlgF [Aneurinibacillus sp. Ricciae_BoGa-3]WCK52892.1 flagellar basal-body rod protein FlgF [Aneurinibacillus sp. Ricciae_BoGa-3]
MLRSLYSGIGGMRGFQTKLDVIGNDISNVNTPGYKKSRVEFQDILSQTMQGGSAPAGTAPGTATTPAIGGTNPKQVGLGSTMASIDVIQTQGALQTTNVPTDLAVQGNGFFVVQDPSGGYHLTRAGNFGFDANGNLVNSNGYFVCDTSGNAIKLKTGNPAGLTINSMSDVTSFSIGKDGKITVTDANGKTGTTSTGIGLSVVANPAGLEKEGNSLYKLTPSADPTNFSNPTATIKPANAGSAGQILAGELEMSNTDLSEEFTDMIVAQRGFQANSRIITVSDSILQELVDLKRS